MNLVIRWPRETEPPDREMSRKTKPKRDHRFFEEWARRNGMALGIGHPYPETIAVLERQLPQLAFYGVTLVPVSELIRRQSIIKRVRMAGAGTSAGENEPVTMPMLKTAPIVFHAPSDNHVHQ